MSKAVFLYTRTGCGLCQQASEMAGNAGVNVTPVDISLSVDLLERYGNSIPVLSYSGNDLFWPFTERDIGNLVRP